MACTRAAGVRHTRQRRPRAAAAPAGPGLWSALLLRTV